MKVPPPPGGKATPNQSVLNLITCILGAGVLGYPYCFKECGIVLATCLMLVSWLACRFSFQLLLYCSQLTNLKTYEKVAESSLGKYGRHIVAISIAALNLGALVAYINILADVLSAVAGTLIPPGADPSRSTYIAGVTVFGALPVALVVRNHSIVVASSTASVGFTALFAFIIVIFSFFPSSAPSTEALQLWNPDGLLVGLPVMAYSFTAHPYYLQIYASMQNPNINTMHHVTDTSMAIVAILYWLVGLGGYITFRQRTAGDVLRNFGGSGVEGMRGAYEHILKLCYGLSVLGAVPLVIMPFQAILLPLLGSDAEDGPKALQQRSSYKGSDVDLPRYEYNEKGMAHRPVERKHSGESGDAAWAPPAKAADSCGLLHDAPTDHDHEEPHLAVAHHVLICFLVIGIAMASALWVPNVEFIFGLVGATASMLVAYILPPLSFLRTLSQQKQQSVRSIANAEDQAATWSMRRWIAVLLLLFGIVSGIMCTDAILGAVQEEAAVVHLAQQIVAREQVVAETSRVEAQASQAAAAVLLASSSAHDLDEAKAGTAATRDNLQKAAAALSTITEPRNASHHPAAAAWDLVSKMKEHNKFVAEVRVMGIVEEQLQASRSEINRTLAGVEALITRLDVAMATIREDRIKQAAAGARNASDAAASEDGAAKGGSGSSSQDVRAQDLAKDLAKALGSYLAPDPGQNATGSSSRSLEQVRSAARHAAEALQGTLYVLDQVAASVAAARHQNKLDAQIKDAAMTAMQQAVEATAWSELAMNITTQALQHATTSETAELITALSRLAHDLKKTTSKQDQAAVEKLTASAASAAAAVPNAAGPSAAHTAGTADSAGSSGASAPPGVATTTATAAATGESTTAAGVQSTAGGPVTSGSGADGMVPGAAVVGSAGAATPAQSQAFLTPEQAAQAILADLSKLISEMEAGQANASSVVESISSAMQYMQGSKAAIMQQLGTALGQSHPKVAQRVMAIMGEVGNAAKMQAGGASILPSADEPALPVRQTAAVVPATAAAGRGGSADGAAAPRPAASTRGDSAQDVDGSAAVAGPVVSVTDNGQLRQEAGDGSDGMSGPVVKKDVAGRKLQPTAESSHVEPQGSAPKVLHRRFGKGGVAA